jgi:P-type Cu2+ transporter
MVMLSGDREAVALPMARTLGINDVRAQLLPQDKLAYVEQQRQQGRHVLMVGDGFNDAPALAAAHISMSPASGIDIAQNAADLVFQGEKLAAVPLALTAARRAEQLVRQNLCLSLLYNVCALPIAVTGHVTPLIAAIAMSGSSLIVILNALRAGQLEEGRP